MITKGSSSAHRVIKTKVGLLELAKHLGKAAAAKLYPRKLRSPRPTCSTSIA